MPDNEPKKTKCPACQGLGGICKLCEGTGTAIPTAGYSPANQRTVFWTPIPWVAALLNRIPTPVGIGWAYIGSGGQVLLSVLIRVLGAGVVLAISLAIFARTCDNFWTGDGCEDSTGLGFLLLGGIGILAFESVRAFRAADDLRN